MSGARVISIYGTHRERCLIDMPVEDAQRLIFDGPEPLDTARPARVLDSLERDLARFRTLDPLLADGTLASSLYPMALELENPYNSAHAKSLCQGRLADSLADLTALLPKERPKDRLDALQSAARGGLSIVPDDGESAPGHSAGSAVRQ